MLDMLTVLLAIVLIVLVAIIAHKGREYYQQSRIKLYLVDVLHSSAIVLLMLLVEQLNYFISH